MKILIAEDDFMSRAVLVAVLEREGHEVTVAVNGAEAWQTLQQPGARLRAKRFCDGGGERHVVHVADGARAVHRAKHVNLTRASSSTSGRAQNQLPIRISL